MRSTCHSFIWKLYVYDLAWQSIIIIVGGNIKPDLTGRFTRCVRRWAGPKEVLFSDSLKWVMLLGSGVSKKKSGQLLLSGYGGGIHTYVLLNGAGVIFWGFCIVPKIFDLCIL